MRVTDEALDRAVTEARLGHEPSAQLVLLEVGMRLLLGERISVSAIRAIADAILHHVKAGTALRFLMPQRKPRQGAPRKVGAVPVLVEALVVQRLREEGFTDSVSKSGRKANLYEEAACQLGVTGDDEIEREAERLRKSGKRARSWVKKTYPSLGDELKRLSRVRPKRGP